MQITSSWSEYKPPVNSDITPILILLRKLMVTSTPAHSAIESMKWRRVGDSLEVKAQFIFNGFEFGGRYRNEFVMSVPAAGMHIDLDDTDSVISFLLRFLPKFISSY